MPKNQSIKSRFKSDYGGGFISASQWLAEFMCHRKALKEKKDLPYKFWNTEEWKKFFMFQVTVSARLLKKYHPLAIAEAARLSKSCYSINAPFLLKSIERMQLKYRDKILEYENVEHEYSPIIEQKEIIIEKPREAFCENKSLVSLLDGE